MKRLYGHLIVVIALAGLSALVVALPRSYAKPDDRRILGGISPQLGSWTERPGVPLLPDDARSIEAFSREYSDGRRTAWLSIARYTGQNGPDHRPSLGTLVPSRGVSSVTRGAVDLSPAGLRVTATDVTVRFQDHGVRVWYWYVLDNRLIGNEYSLRFWLALNTLLRRDRELLLIRAATADDDSPADFVRALAPALARLRE